MVDVAARLRTLPPTKVYLGLGTNVGDRLGNLRRALFALATHPEIDVTGMSRIYETEYVGPGHQDPFFNACLELGTRLRPQVLLAVLKGTEERLGRALDGHMKPRPIDLDTLLYGEIAFDSAKLQIPHKHMRDRAFVLEPLAELASGEFFPDSGETIGNACAKIRRKSGPWVRPLEEIRLVDNRPESNKEDWRAALAVHCR